MRISDWSSDVCSSDLAFIGERPVGAAIQPLVVGQLPLLPGFRQWEVGGLDVTEDQLGQIDRVDQLVRWGYREAVEILNDREVVADVVVADEKGCVVVELQEHHDLDGLEV